ncbi:MAG: putative dithiol-disulfide isomerase involved in polyketide biosynthesis [Herbinix sp.]|nr:putative dithiol-disulfide isomerase involved in polyketide biosynthesis [Herbinix sp.]
MKVEIWFDFVCPFCYLGDTKFEKALAEFEHKAEVELVFRSFRLNMANEDTKGKDIHQVVAEKYHISYEQSKANNERIAEAGREVGLNYNFDAMKLNDTEFAHQIMQYAKRFQKDHALIKRYFKAYFEEGMDIGSQEALLQIAGELGLDISELNRELASGVLKTEIQKDEAAARKYGIDTIPHFIIDGKYAVTGAQNVEYFLAALRKVHAQN